MGDVRENLAQVTATLEGFACTVVAVSKKQSNERILEAVEAGLLDFGENYAQELDRKAKEIANPALRWHYIGRLQRNKVKFVVGVATLIHAVDSERLLAAIDKQAAERNIVQKVLLSVNIAGEESKGGVAAAEVEGLIAAAQSMNHVEIAGLMTMPPLAEKPEDSRVHFAALRALRDRTLGPEAELSMGTSSDYRVAAEEGATLLRIGTSLLGPRPG